MSTSVSNNLIEQKVSDKSRKYVYKLVDGNYDLNKATDILFDLINSKISFHNQNSFGNEERFGEESVHSKKRIAELKAVRESLKHVLEMAKSKDLDVQLKSTIELELVKK